MIERVVAPPNLHKALGRVISNGGSAGVDRMGVMHLTEYLSVHGAELHRAVSEGTYRPKPILGVSIPKSNGSTRLLGVPTVSDRYLQQAAHQVIMPLFEVEFKAHSYGFRPGRSAQQAVLRAEQHINEGYQHIVDIDLKNFFDEVDHCILFQLLYRKVKCPYTMRLIRQWCRAPIEVNGKLIKRRKGVPQGSPLSPLLSNIMLHELDRELEKRGLRYVRYADDFSIYLKEEATARTIDTEIRAFLEERLKLPVNHAKSGIRKPEQFELLGYGFVAKYKKDEDDPDLYHPVVGSKGWETLKRKIKSITRKTTPLTFADRIAQLNTMQRGWLNYFRLARMGKQLGALEGWVRSRLRYCIWHHWKKPSAKRTNLIRLGIPPQKAFMWSNTRKGGWRTALSPILNTSITTARLKIRGYCTMLDHYRKTAPHLNEPLYTRPVRTVV